MASAASDQGNVPILAASLARFTTVDDHFMPDNLAPLRVDPADSSQAANNALKAKGPIWEAAIPPDIETPGPATIKPLNPDTMNTNPSAELGLLWVKPQPAPAVPTDADTGPITSVASQMAEQVLVGPLGFNNEENGLCVKAGVEPLADMAGAAIPLEAFAFHDAPL
ncbi:hypothetical protein MCEMSEM23_00270 [Rhabdaerophilaceae bacterium]